VKITELDLRAFGPFTGVRLDLSAGSQGLHIVFGPNEAGKSSALRALEQALFGIPQRSQDDFRHVYKDLRVGGTLVGAGGRQLSFLRRKGQRATLLATDNETLLPDNALSAFLGAVDGELFSAMFALSHERLVQGGQEIAKGSGAVGQLLFAAGSGLTEVRKALASIEEEAAALFNPSKNAKTPLVNADLRAADEARKRLKQTQLKESDWTHQKIRFDEAQARAADAKDRLARLRAERARLDRIEQALPLIEMLRQWKTDREALGTVRLLRAGFAEQRRQLASELQLARAQEAAAAAELQRIDEQVKGLAVADWRRLAAHGATLKQLNDDRGAYLAAQRDLPDRQQELRQAEALAAALVGRIRPGWTLADAERLALPVELRARVEELARQHEGVLRGVRESSEQIVEATEEQRQAQSALAEVAEPPDTALLAQAVRHAVALGDIAAIQSKVEARLRRLSEQAEAALRRLPKWSASLDALVTTPAPQRATVERFEAQLGELSRRLEAARQRREAVADERQTVAEEIQRMQWTGEVVDEEQLAAARVLRDEGWALVVAQWRGKVVDRGRVVDFVGRFPGSADLADAFAQAMRRADECGDRLRRESERVSEMAALRKRKAAIDARLNELAGDESALRVEFEAAQGQWRDAWLPIEIGDAAPAEMRGWLDARQSLIDQWTLLSGERAERDVVVERIGALEAEIAGLLADLGAPAPAAVVGLTRLVEFAQTTLSEFDRARQLGEQHRRVVASADARLASLQAKAERAKADQQRWQDDWNKVVGALGLAGEASPSVVMQTLGEIDNVLRELDRAREARGRIEAIEGYSAKFRATLESLTRELATDLVEQPVAEAAERLLSRFREAEAGMTRLADLERQRARQDDLFRKAASQVERHLGQLELLREEAGCGDLAELPELEQRSDQARALDGKLDQVRGQLAHLAAGVELDQFAADCLREAAEALPSRPVDLDEPIAGCERELQSANQEVGAMAKALADLDARSEAAGISSEMQGLLARAARSSQDYCRLQLAAAVLKTSIRRYQEKSEGPVLRAAGEFFRRLTCGSFDRLVVDESEKGDQILKGHRSGGEVVEMQGMSEGTRDQLYLALRLASLEYYFQQAAEPLPLVVDDVLISFDDRRAEAALRILGEMSRKTQVVLFTHHDHLARLAEAVLPAGTVFAHALSAAAAASA